jgi:hypothetical protein
VEISKYARALPSILGLKERGRGLPILGDQLVAVAPILDLYLLDTREFLNLAAITTPTVGFNLFTESVPPGEMWRIWSFLALGTMAAGEAIDMCAAYRADTSIGISLCGVYCAGAATNHVATGNQPGQEFWAPAGTQFGFLVRSITTAPDIGGYLTFTRLKI